MSEQPTEIIPSVPAEVDGSRHRRRWVLPLIIGLILVAGSGVVGGVLLLHPTGQDAAAPATNGTASPSPTRTPAPTPSSTPSLAASPGASAAGQPRPSAAQPSAPAPGIESFSVGPQTVTCSAPAPGVPGLTSTPLTISWSITGGARAWIGVDTDDAMAEPYAEVSAEAGSTTDIQFLCTDDHRYTLTVLGADGQLVSRTLTVVNIGDR